MLPDIYIYVAYLLRPFRIMFVLVIIVITNQASRIHHHSTTMSRVLTGAVLAAVCAFGAYSAFDPIGWNGVAPAILKSHVVPASERYCPGAPTPFRDTYTGITVLDNEVRTLVCFFAIILQGPQKEDIPWASLYLFVQLFGSWALIALEGLRRGNRGRLVSW